MSKMLLHSYIEDIANRLWRPSVFGHVSIMVGAGFSKNAVSLNQNSKLPDWNELSRYIFKKLYPMPTEKELLKKWEENCIRKTSGKNAIKIAEEYTVTFGKPQLDKLIEQFLDDKQYNPGKLHIELLELPWADVFTTNYDTLLERTISLINIKNRRNYNIVLKQEDIPGSVRPRIIKLHGSIPYSRPYIIGEEDYRTYPQLYAPFVNTVQQAMLETQLCLIGFSGDDPNFMNWLGWLRDNMQKNCPRIYLCGVFDELSDSEKKLLENKNIVIVDLGLLVGENSKNKYEEAYEKFFSELRKLKASQQIIEPLKYIINDDTTILTNSYQIAYEQLKREHTILSDYIALPLDLIINTSKNIDDYLKRYLNTNITLENKLDFIYELVWRKGRCYIPLNDREAKSIEKLVEDTNIERLIIERNNTDIRAWIGLNLELCKMYRQVGKDDMYNLVINRLEKYLKCMNLNEIVSFKFEKCRFHLRNLEYQKLLEVLESIGESEDFEVLIKKACILSQIGNSGEALKLLRQLSAKLAQSNFSKEKVAAWVGYINLCYRSLNIQWNSQHSEYSDMEYEDIKFNVRTILIELKEMLMSAIFCAQEKNVEKEKAFNPNAYTLRYGTIPNEKIEAEKASFRYLIFIDDLFIPIFKDHFDSIKEAINLISRTSESPIWRWSFIIRANDNKVYDKYFTRSCIIYNDCNVINLLYDNLVKLIKANKNFVYKKNNRLIISFKSNIDLLSRFALRVDDEKLWELIELLKEISNDETFKFEINRAVERIYYCCNDNFLSKHLDSFLSDKTGFYSMIYHFDNICEQEIDKEVIDAHVPDIISDIKSTDIKKRDRAIDKVILLSGHAVIRDYERQISNAIWGQRDVNGFPKSNMFTPIAWKQFLYPTDINYDELIKQYLLNISWPRCVDGISIHGFTNTLDEIYTYLNILYVSSKLKRKPDFNIKWSSDELLKILKLIIDYSQNEEKLLENFIAREFDIFGFSEEARKRFLIISDIVTVLGMLIIEHNAITEEIINNISKYNEFAKKYFENYIGVEAILNILNDVRCDRKLEMIQNIVYSNEDESKSAYTTLNVLLCINEFNDKTIHWPLEIIKELISSLPYMRLNQSRIAFFKLQELLSRNIFLEEEFIDSLSRSLLISYISITNLAELQEDPYNRDPQLLDLIYNLSMLTYKYVTILNENQITINNYLEQLRQKLSISKLPEIRRLWFSYRD